MPFCKLDWEQKILEREAAIISVLADWGIKDINQFQRQKTNCGLLYYNCSTVSGKDNKWLTPVLKVPIRTIQKQKTICN